MTAVIVVVAFVASLLTLFSGFGLGTLLTPAAALFFPVATAVALTALVHFLNSLFKIATFWPHVAWSIVWRFGPPALVASAFGAWILTWLDGLPVLARYALGERAATVTPVSLAVGVLLTVFAAVEAFGVAKRVEINGRHLALGGVVSGFFGGLSGHQGAFRSAFLLHAGLDARGFVATNAAIACMVDAARLAVYGVNLRALRDDVEPSLIAAAALAAFAGVMVGRLGVKKVTIGLIRKIVAALLFALGLLIAAGLI